MLFVEFVYKFLLVRFYSAVYVSHRLLFVGKATEFYD